MVLALTCGASSRFLGRTCMWIDDHDSTGLLGPFIERVLGPLLVLVVLYSLGRIFRHFVERAMVRSAGDPQIKALVHNVISVVSIVTAILAAVTTAGVNVGVLLTFGGIASLAIGLAFQDLLRNVLAGIFLLLERPFRIGDFITVGDQSGIVQAIQLRTTRLRTVDGKLAILPNLAAFSNPIVNNHAYSLRRYSVSVWVMPEENLAARADSIRNILAETKELDQKHKPTIQLHLDKEAAGLLVECQYWLDWRKYNPDEISRRLSSKFAGVATD